MTRQKKDPRASPDSPVYSYLLKEALKNTTIDLPFYEDAVRVVDFYHLFEEEDIYSFVIGFNQNQIPQVLKDENYLSDKDIEELALLTTKEKNKKYKEATLSILKSLSNLTVSYCDKTLSNTLYPSFFKRYAATALSTPPLIPTTTVSISSPSTSFNIIP